MQGGVIRSKNRKKHSDTKTEAGSFGAYRVTVKGLGSLSIFAESARAAEQAARRILGGMAQAYDGPLEVHKEEKTDTRRQH